MRKQLHSSLAIVLALLLGACASKQLEPLTVSSAAQRGYATEYPATLARLRGQVTQNELHVQQILGEFPTYTAQLDKPHWADVEAAVNLADQEGKSQSFVDAYDDNQKIAGFLQEDGKTIKQKVGGAAQFAAKEKTCDVELYGPTSHAFDKSVEKQLQDRAESKSEAVQYIEDNSDRLLEKNVEKLKAQVGKISEASYLTHVAVRQTSRDIQVLLGEASTVKGTLEAAVEQAKSVQSDATRLKADVARAAERQKAAEAALANLDSEVKQAEHVQTTVEERAKKLDAAYEQAFEALKDAIEAQAKAETK